MWIGLAPSDVRFWQQVAAFARKSALPKILAWDRAAVLPAAVWRALGRKGLLGIPFPRSLGGGGKRITRLALALDAFAYGAKDLGIVNAWGVHTAMAGLAVLGSGHPDLARKLIPALASGKRIGAFALTEPDAGSHVAAMRMTARRDGDGYVLAGRKTFVTNGPEADVFVVAARDSDGAENAYSAFVVERGMPGVDIGPADEKTCIRTSPCGAVVLRDCRVPADHLLGPRGRAMEAVILPALDRDRCVVWAGRLGRLRSMLEDATAYAAKRVQFGRPIARHQAILFRIADMKVRLETAESVLSAALHQLENGASVRTSAAIARHVVGAATLASADDSMQIFGGYGFYPENHVERYHRDSRLDGIGGGSTEIQKMIVGREVVRAVDPESAWMSPCVTPGAWLVRGSGRRRPVAAAPERV